MIKKIRGSGSGWAFTGKDFSHLGSHGAVRVCLHRLHKKGLIRHLDRGIYDYPTYSSLLSFDLSPDIDGIARAIARRFGWRIHPNGECALNVLGLSTQVPARYCYLTDGPSKRYTINGTELVFKHQALKDTGFDRSETALMVQALKALGPSLITPHIIERLRRWLPSRLKRSVLRDIGPVTGWIADAIRKVCIEGQDG